MLRKLALATTVGVSLAGCSGINAFGTDKVLHMAAGAAVGVTSEKLGMTEEQACMTVIAVGIAKEIIDPVFTPMDVVATMVYCGKLLNKENMDGQEEES